MKTPSVFTLATIALLAFTVRASAIPISNIVKNGGFETGDFSNWHLSGNTGGTARTSAARTSAFGVDHDSAHTGNYGAFASPNGSLGFLRQTLDTVAGATYQLSFWLQAAGGEAAQAASAAHPLDFQVFWNGDLIYETFAPPAAYTHFTFSGLTTDCDCIALTFGFRNDFGSFHLDDVVGGIAPQVPEFFSTIWLLLPAGLLLALAHPRKQPKTVTL